MLREQGTQYLKRKQSYHIKLSSFGNIRTDNFYHRRRSVEQENRGQEDESLIPKRAQNRMWVKGATLGGPV